MRLLEGSGAPSLTLAAVGDVGIVGSARARAAREGWDAPFAALRPALMAAGLGFANLEFPVGAREWVRAGRSDEFFHDAEVLAALVRAGVHVVSLANNHVMDCGPRGLLRTLECCSAAGLACVGAGADLEAARAPARFERAGRRVVLLGYSSSIADAAAPGHPGVAPLDPELIAADLARWRSVADLLVVSAHWGSMYVDYPPPRVTEMARAITAAGADVILGHHPHVLQGVEHHGRAVVLYSLGDVAFNCRAGDFHAEVATRSRLESAVFTILSGEGGVAVDAEPLLLDEDGFPAACPAGDAAAQLERLAALGRGLTDAAGSFAAQSAPTLLQYELQSMGTYLRQGRWDRVAKLLGGVRPRHVPLLGQAVNAWCRKLWKRS